MACLFLENYSELIVVINLPCHSLIAFTVQVCLLLIYYYKPGGGRLFQNPSIYLLVYRATRTAAAFSSPVDLVKRPLIVETRIPHLIDNSHGVLIILARRPGHHRLDGPRAHAVLELLCQTPVSSCEGLASPPALAA